MRKPLLDQIESEAMDGDVVKALRLCIRLGGHSGSVNLRQWAERELNGYAFGDSSDEMPPPYRLVQAPLCMDGIAGLWRTTGYQIPLGALPEFAQKAANEGLWLFNPISELRDMAQRMESIHLAPVWGLAAVSRMNAAGTTNGATRLYWTVQPEVVNTVVERVRTDLIRLVNEMRPRLENGQDFPSADMASQAVNVVISGDNNRVDMKEIEQTAQSDSIGQSPKRSKLEIACWVAGIVSAIVALAPLIYFLVLSVQ